MVTCTGSCSYWLVFQAQAGDSSFCQEPGASQQSVRDEFPSTFSRGVRKGELWCCVVFLRILGLVVKLVFKVIN